MVCNDCFTLILFLCMWLSSATICVIRICVNSSMCAFAIFRNAMMLCFGLFCFVFFLVPLITNRMIAVHHFEVKKLSNKWICDDYWCRKVTTIGFWCVPCSNHAWTFQMKYNLCDGNYLMGLETEFGQIFFLSSKKNVTFDFCVCLW